MLGNSGGKMIVNHGKWYVVFVGKERRHTLFSTQYVYNEFISGAVVYVVT